MNLYVFGKCLKWHNERVCHNRVYVIHKGSLNYSVFNSALGSLSCWSFLK